MIDSDSTNRQHIDDFEPTDFDLVQEELATDLKSLMNPNKNLKNL